MTVVVRGATVIAMPNPTTTIGSKNATQYELVTPDAAKRAKPAATIVGLFFILGVVAAPFLPETNGKPLPHALWLEEEQPAE